MIVTHIRACCLSPATGMVIGLLTLVGCSSTATSNGFSAPPSPTMLKTVTAQAITFSYPSNWSRTQWDQPSSFSYLVAAVSNAPLRAPCTHTANSWSCGQPVMNMKSGMVMVEWWENGFPTWTLDAQPGRPATVRGFRAKIQDPANLKQVCSNIAGYSAMQVLVERPQAASNYFAFDACFKGPEIDGERVQAMAILDSARFKS